MDRQDLIRLSGAVAVVASQAPDFDGHDPWGSTMHVWFECAERLNRRGEYVPVDWEFASGLRLGELDNLYAEYTNPYLIMLGNNAQALAKVCETLGLAY